MPITLNGNGTITGVAVGGLPDGIVDTDMLAANAVSSAKLASGVGGKVLQTVNAVHSTQVETSDGSVVDTGLTADITLTNSNSKVLIFVTQQLMSQQYNSTGDSDCALILTRVTSGSSTNIFNGSAVLTSCRTGGEGSGSWFVRSANLASIVSQDTPGAGTHTYKTRLKHKSRSGTGSRTCDGSHPAEIILWEVAP